MNDLDDPRRLFDNDDVPLELRRLLQRAHADATPDPMVAQLLHAVASRAPMQAPPLGQGKRFSWATRSGRLSTKLVLVAALVGLGAGTLYVVGRSDGGRTRQISVPSAAPSQQPPPPADQTAGEATVAPNPADVGAPARPAAAESPSPAARQRATAPARAGRASTTSPGIATVATVSTDTVLGTTSVDEFRLLRAARQALAERPARALELTDEHARRFARGMLSQEREAIAVDALVQLGREGQARTRAQAFLGAYPSSPYRSRVERVLGHAVGAGNKP